MLFYLYKYLIAHGINLPGLNLLRYISFRTAISLLMSLGIALIYGKKIIAILRRRQMGELVRDLGLEGQKQKEGTPTMGGLIIILATLVPVLLFTEFNIYILLLLGTMLGMGAIGFLDDYLKKIKKNKDGLSGKFKVIGQVAIGLLVGVVMYLHPDTVVRRPYADKDMTNRNEVAQNFMPQESISVSTVPFLKNNEFDYSKALFWIDNPEEAQRLSWIIYIPAVIFIITAVSNGANITDGIDGLAAGTSAIILFTLGVFAYLSGNMIFADYLNIMYLPQIGETTIFVLALMGALIGFFWYNTYPAQVFMGDTGSLMLGGVIATVAIILRKELMIPVLCGIFLIENLSVVLQVAWFKYLKKKKGLEYAQNNRLFRMSPLHHHYQKGGFHESKIVMRFLIIGIMLAVTCLITLKLR